MNSAPFWTIVDGNYVVALSPTALAITALGILVFALALVLFMRFLFKRYVNKYYRTYHSLHELKQRYTASENEFKRWEETVAAKRVESKNQINQLQNEIQHFADDASAKRPVHDELLRRMVFAREDVKRLEFRHESIANAIDRKDELNQEIESLELEVVKKCKERENLDEQLINLQLKVDLYTREDDLITVGHYEEPDYLHSSSERYKVQIKSERGLQKGLIATSGAISGLDQFDDDATLSALTRQSKLLLKAFNLECDKLFSNVKHSNYTQTVEQVESLAHSLEHLMGDLRIGLSLGYVESKLRECTLVYQEKYKAREEQKLQEDEFAVQQNAENELHNRRKKITG